MECPKINAIFRFFFGENLNMREFEPRLKVQKIMYLLTASGYDTGYKQTWYVRGPYSPVLSTDAYNATFMIEKNELPPFELSDDEKTKFGVLKDSFADYLDDADQLELLVSLLYVLKVEINDISEASAALKSRKPWFTDEQINAALQKIVDNTEILKIDTLTI